MLAGASLTAFCYNRVQNQQLIAKLSDLFFSRFHSLIQSKDEIHSANASFQVNECLSSMFVVMTLLKCLFNVKTSSL